MNFHRWLENKKYMAKGVSTRGDHDTQVRMAGLATLGSGPKDIASDPVVAARGMPRTDSVTRALRQMGLTGDVRKQIKSLVTQAKGEETHKDQVRYDMQNNRNTHGFNPKRDSVGVGGSAHKKASVPPPGFLKVKKPMDYGTGWDYEHVPAEDIDQYTDSGWQVVKSRKRNNYGKKAAAATAPQIKPEPNVVPMQQRPMVGKPSGSFTDNDIQSFFGNRKAN